MDEKQYKQYKENLKKYQREYQKTYQKEHYKIAAVKFDLEFFNSELFPVIQKSGLTTNAWIKEACLEKLERDMEK